MKGQKPKKKFMILLAQRFEMNAPKKESGFSRWTTMNLFIGISHYTRLAREGVGTFVAALWPTSKPEMKAFVD